MRKWVDKTATSNVVEERIYYGSYEVYRKWSSATVETERTTLHISDDAGRIAMIERRLLPDGGGADDTGGGDADADVDAATDDTIELLTRYIYGNHLDSSSLEADETGAVISYEEYHPYGTTAYQANNSDIKAVAKRYRYTGKERDEESGLNYHGARYYIPWLARWCAVDLLESKYAGMSPYNYCFNNPVSHTDNSGMGPEDSGDNKGVWYWDKKSNIKYDKEHTYTDFPTSKGIVHGTDFTIGWDNLGLSRHYKQDGTTEDTAYGPPTESHNKSHVARRHDNKLSAAHATASHSSGVGLAMSAVNRPAAHPSQATNNNGIGLTMEKVADVVTDFIPIVGGVKDIYRGIRDGNGWGIALGAGSLALDLFTFGGGSIFKGSIKTAVKQLGKSFVKEEVGHFAGTGTIGLIEKGGEKATAYSVAYETKISEELYHLRRPYHFREANKNLLHTIDNDANFAAQMEQVIPDIRNKLIGPKGGLSKLSPQPWTWHHTLEPGVLQLVPRVQHESPLFRHLFHPGGFGGNAIWGGAR